MKFIKYTLIIFLALLFTNQVSIGVMDSQKAQSEPPATSDEGLYFFGWTQQSVTGVLTDAVKDPFFTIDAAADWDDIAVGEDHVLAIKDGRLYSWGNNGSFKTGLVTSIGRTFIPTQIGSDTNWSSVSAGDNHSAAIKTDSTLWTWGAGSSGQLGHGGTSNFSSPTQVGTDTNWTKVSCGSSWTAAIKGGQLLTFGSNSVFRTGLNTSTGSTLSPTVANTDTDWTYITAGNLHGLGVKAGQLWSWGANTNGRTGQGTTSGSTQIPTQVGSDTDWSSCNAGTLHSMAIKTTGTLWGLGSQFNGRLGNGVTTNTNQLTPTQAGTDTDWASVNCNGNSTVASSSAYTYAIKTTGSVWATGINSEGQLGQPLSTAESGDFLQVGSITNATKVGAGGGFGIVLRNN